MSRTTVDHWMTPAPRTLRGGESLARAREVLTEIGARHLPILEGGAVLGVLSDRDILLAGHRGHDLDVATCAEWCIDEPHTVDVDTTLSTAATIMAEKRIGSLLVTDEGKLTGIFTTTDACRALAALTSLE